MTDVMSIGQAVDDALAAYEELAALAETIEDEWTYVTDLARRLAERLEAVAAARGARASRPPEQAAVERAIDEIGRITRPAPRHRLAVHVPAGRARGARRAAVRFQDAAKDARAVVYAGIQADPLVARAATPARRRQRRPARAGPGGHERRDARPGRLADDVPDALRAGGRRRPAGSARRPSWPLAGGRRPRRAGPQPGPRRARGGAHRQLLARAWAPARSGASGASCSTACRAEIHPYDVTVERAGRRRGLRLQVGRAGHQRGRAPPARRRACQRGGRGRAAPRGPRRLRRGALLPGAPGPPDRAPRPHGPGDDRVAGAPGRLTVRPPAPRAGRASPRAGSVPTTASRAPRKGRRRP